jgi:hypothetical protein
MSYRSRIMSHNHFSKRFVEFVLYILNKYSGENHERKDQYGMNYLKTLRQHYNLIAYVENNKEIIFWINYIE